MLGEEDNKMGALKAQWRRRRPLPKKEKTEERKQEKKQKEQKPSSDSLTSKEVKGCSTI